MSRYAPSASMMWRPLIALALLSSFHAAASAQDGLSLLSSADTAIGIDLDATFLGPQNNGRYPNAENPPKALDGLSTTKYLNFGGAGSGFIVTPAATGIPVDAFQITTANDAPGRDPAFWSLYGFDGALTTTDSGADPAINQTGVAEAWTLISSGAVSLPGDPSINNDQRGVVGPMVAVNSATPYQHYKFIVDAIKVPSAGIMQFADIQFFADDTNLSSGFLASTDPIIAVDETPIPAGWPGLSPANEGPHFAIDRDPNTKYLNFGKERSGIIITNSDGPVDVNYMRLTTANDAVERDPASYELYGTNDPITSEPNSSSNGTETWTLISSGPLSLPGVLPNGGGDDARLTRGPYVEVHSPVSYTSYRLIFPTVKGAAAANSMQIADIQFFTAIPEPASLALGVMAGAAFVVRFSRNS